MFLSIALRRSDHPRSRGVYRVPTHSSPSRPGSSPLARGLRCNRLGVGVSAGIIPARAGFTLYRYKLRARAKDHPRSRGVYMLSRMTGLCPRGSSPLARGLQGNSNHDYRACWIIPARAGFTPGRVSGSLLDRGSSPLARGLQCDVEHRSKYTGIIPARAGFTRCRRRRRGAQRDHPRSRGVYM